YAYFIYKRGYIKKLSQLIIIGGGLSIQKGIKKNLWEKIGNRFTIGINYSYKYFQSTCLICMNYTDFYDTNRKTLKKLPLIVTCSRPHPSKWEENTILINKNFALSGILALYVGLLLEPKEIFLLGYDYGGKDNNTHFYQNDINHQGIGKVVYYNHQGHVERDFNQFKNTKTKIYNVSPNSNINSFEKIDYQTFFNKLDNVIINQYELKKEIKKSIGGEK
ncbi:hypothetical protein LCGC14_1194850, partial [marine sediment metagenome]